MLYPGVYAEGGRYFSYKYVLCTVRHAVSERIHGGWALFQLKVCIMYSETCCIRAYTQKVALFRTGVLGDSSGILRRVNRGVMG